MLFPPSYHQMKPAPKSLWKVFHFWGCFPFHKRPPALHWRRVQTSDCRAGMWGSCVWDGAGRQGLFGPLPVALQRPWRIAGWLVTRVLPPAFAPRSPFPCAFPWTGTKSLQSKGQQKQNLRPPTCSGHSEPFKIMSGKKGGTLSLLKN